MTYPVRNPSASAPWACPTKNSCMGIEAGLKGRTEEAANLRAQLNEALDDLRALSAQLAIKTSTVELTKAQERIAAYQAIEIQNRKTIDYHEAVTSGMRDIFRTNGYDLALVDEILSTIRVKSDLADA